MHLSFSLLLAAGVGTVVPATAAVIEPRSPTPFSTFTHNPVYLPAQDAPLWRVAYSRAIQVADGSLLLTWEDYPAGETATNLDTFKILRSIDGGATWANHSKVADTQNGWGMRFQPHMYITQQSYGRYPAGTLLVAGVSTPLSLHGGVYIDVYASSDVGKTWTFASHVAYGAGPETVATGDKAIWEPFFVEYKGKLIIYFSDQRDNAHSQKLSLSTTTDIKTWSTSSDVVAWADPNARPGMAVVTYVSSIKKYLLTYEVCGSSGCPAYFRLAADPYSFMIAPESPLVTTTGYHAAASPYSVYYAPSEAIIVSTNSDTDLFVSKDGAKTFYAVNVDQWTGQSRHLLLFNDNGKSRLHLTTGGFYGCSGVCYNYVANGVIDPSTL